MKHNSYGVLMVLGATLIWGTSFVFQANGNDLFGPLTFNALRFLTASVFTALVSFPRRPVLPGDRSVSAGILSGICLFAMTALQQLGLHMGVAVGKTGFLVSTSVLFVPVICTLLGKKQASSTWIAASVTACGMYFLCMSGPASFALPDLVIVFSALAGALQILILDRFSDRIVISRFTLIQFMTCALFSTVFAVLFEGRMILQIRFSLPALSAVLYTGILASGVAYSLQAGSQKLLPASAVSVLLCFESVFAALAGWALLQEALSAGELFGCTLIFLGALIPQIPVPFLPLQRLRQEH